MKKSKILLIIDMQEDFITGTLANKSAQDIIPVIVDEIEKGEYNHIVFTQDTHALNYLNTPEGKALPIEHCIKDTKGWEINKDIEKAALISDSHLSWFEKPTFGSLGILSHIQAQGDFDEIVMCGTCTDICVVSNALILKTLKPDLKITVLGKACAGVTIEKHEAALNVMESCQINVIR